MVFVDTSAALERSELLVDWLQPVMGIGVSKGQWLLEQFETVDELAHMVELDEKMLRKTLGAVAAARIEQKLESEGHIKPRKQTRTVGMNDKSMQKLRFVIKTARPFIDEFCKRNHYVVADNDRRYNGVKLTYVLRDAAKDEDRNLAVITRHNSRGFAVMNALGEMSLVLDEWFSGGLILASKKGWRNQYKMDNRHYLKNTRVIFLDE